MKATFTWTAKEWNEVLVLARTRESNRVSMPGLTYGLVLVPALAAFVELPRTLSGAGLSLGGSIMPMILVMMVIAFAVMPFLSGRLQHRSHLRQRPMPMGVCQVLVDDSGRRLGAPSAVNGGGAIPPLYDSSNGRRFGSGRRSSGSREAVAWNVVTGSRRGKGVVLLLHQGGFSAVPVRSLTEEQLGHLLRLTGSRMRSAMIIRVRTLTASPLQVAMPAGVLQPA